MKIRINKTFQVGYTAVVDAPSLEAIAKYQSEHQNAGMLKMLGEFEIQGSHSIIPDQEQADFAIDDKGQVVSGTKALKAVPKKKGEK